MRQPPRAVGGLQRALVDLCDEDRQIVVVHIEGWKSGGEASWRRIAGNIEIETALVHAEFVRLLEAFASQLRNGAAAQDAWVCACRSSQLLGRPLPPHQAPEVVGRALALDAYASMIAPSAGLTEEQAKDVLREVIAKGLAPPPRLARILENAPVGRYVVWATFDRQQPHLHPFRAVERTTASVRTAFGLSHYGITDVLALIAYHAKSRGLELRRPTVADAASFDRYRPCTNASELHGWTVPLPPNPDALPNQPEVVHAEALGTGLVFPVYSTS